MIPARTEYGSMIDFLRANTWCSREEYLWGMTVAQVSLASSDFSHIDYSERRSKRKKRGGGAKTINSARQLKNMTDFGAPIVKTK